MTVLTRRAVAAGLFASGGASLVSPPAGADPVPAVVSRDLVPAGLNFFDGPTGPALLPSSEFDVIGSTGHCTARFGTVGPLCQMAVELVIGEDADFGYRDDPEAGPDCGPSSGRQIAICINGADLAWSEGSTSYDFRPMLPANDVDSSRGQSEWFGPGFVIDLNSDPNFVHCSVGWANMTPYGRVSGHFPLLLWTVRSGNATTGATVIGTRDPATCTYAPFGSQLGPGARMQASILYELA